VVDPTRPEMSEQPRESEDLFNFDLLTNFDTSPAPRTSIDLEELVAALPSLGVDEPPAEPEPEELAEEDEDAPPVEERIYVEAREVRTRLSPILIAVLLLLTAINVLAVGFTWRTGQRLEKTVSDVGRTVVQTTEDLRDEAVQRSQEVRDIVAPIVSPTDAGDARTFELIRTDLDAGDFAMARKRLWGVLAVVDRYEPERRDDLEARADFLLADSLRLEAKARAEELP